MTCPTYHHARPGLHPEQVVRRSQILVETNEPDTFTPVSSQFRIIFHMFFGLWEEVRAPRENSSLSYRHNNVVSHCHAHHRPSG